MSELAEQIRSGQQQILDLTLNNPSSALPNYPHAEIRQAFLSLQDFGYAPDPLGIVSARESISAFYAKEGIDVAPCDLALTSSTSEAYSVLIKLLCDAEDEILVPSPSYPLFDFLANLENVRVVPYRLTYDGLWSVDFEHLAHQISAASRAIVIVSPNNPTGSFLKKWELEQLTQIAAKHDLALLADEVFMHYGFARDVNRVPTMIGHDEVLSFSLNGLSKTAGMPQMKLAWTSINGPSRQKRAALERLELILDTYLSVNTPVQLSLSKLLAIGERIRAELLLAIRANLSRTADVLKDTPVHALHNEGGWSVILQLPRTRPEEEWLYRLLGERGTLMQPGYFFDMPSEAYAVASLIVDPAIFKKGLEQLSRLVTDTGG